MNECISALKDKISAAFLHRVIPNIVTESVAAEDAYFFCKKVWSELKIEDWDSHSDAIFEFTPEAFCYYIQSIIILQLTYPEKQFYVMDLFLSFIDNRNQKHNEYILERMKLLTNEEISAVIDWIARLESDDFCDGRQRDDIITNLNKLSR